MLHMWLKVDNKDKSYREARHHCYFTGKCKDTTHCDCDVRYAYQKKAL